MHCPSSRQARRLWQLKKWLPCKNHFIYYANFKLYLCKYNESSIGCSFSNFFFQICQIYLNKCSFRTWHGLLAPVLNVVAQIVAEARTAVLGLNAGTWAGELASSLLAGFNLILGVRTARAWMEEKGSAEGCHQVWNYPFASNSPASVENTAGLRKESLFIT